MRHLLRSGRRPGFRPRAALAAVITAGLLASIAPLSLHAAARAEAADDRNAAPEIVFAPDDPIVRADTKEIEFSVVVTNPSTESLEAGRVELHFDGARVTPEAGLDAQRETPLDARTLLADATIGATPSDDEQTVTITVPVADLPLNAASTPGVYLVDAVLLPGDQPTDSGADSPQAALPPTASGTTPIVWRGPGTETIQLSTIVPIVLPSEVHTLPTRRQLSDASPQWTALLSEARKHNATLAIDPRIIAAIRAYGNEAPDNAALVLGELEAYPHDTFLLQFADADPAAQAALGFEKLLGPESLDFVSRFGSFTDTGSTNDSGTGSGNRDGETPGPGSQTPGSGGTEAPKEPAEAEGADGAPEEPTLPALPTLEELTAWPADPVAWPAEGEASVDTLDLLKRSGINSVVLDSSNTTPSGGPRATVGDAAAVVTDRALGDAARTAIAGDSDIERRAGSAALMAELTLAAQAHRPGLVLGLDRGATGDAAPAASELLTQLSALPWVTSLPVTSQPTGTATLKSADPLESRTELLRAATGREAGVNEMGAVLDHPEYLVGYQRSRLLELFATRHAAPGVSFETVAGEYRARDAELLRGVQAISTELTQLVGVSTRVPVQLRNSLPFDATVDLAAVPSSAALSVEERDFRNVAVPAEANERVLIPVRSRVSSGESGIVVSVTAAGGSPTVYTGTLAITISTVVETVGLTIIGVLASLLLGFGIWRSVRRKRRSAAPAPE